MEKASRVDLVMKALLVIVYVGIVCYWVWRSKDHFGAGSVAAWTFLGTWRVKGLLQR